MFPQFSNLCRISYLSSTLYSIYSSFFSLYLSIYVSTDLQFMLNFYLSSMLYLYLFIALFFSLYLSIYVSRDLQFMLYFLLILNAPPLGILVCLFTNHQVCGYGTKSIDFQYIHRCYFLLSSF